MENVVRNGLLVRFCMLFGFFYYIYYQILEMWVIGFWKDRDRVVNDLNLLLLLGKKKFNIFFIQESLVFKFVYRMVQFFVD